MKNLKRCLLVSLACAGFMWCSPSLMAEPEELNQKDIRQEVLQKEDMVVDFLKKASMELNEKVQASIGDGSVDPKDMDSIKGALAKHTKSIFLNAAKLRKTLKEPEQRLKLDMEMVSLGSQSGLMSEVIKVVQNWKGDIKEVMTITAAQILQQMKVEFTPEFDALLKEAAGSKDPEVVKAAKKMLNAFFRSPAGKAFPKFPTGMKTTDGKELTLARFKGKVLLVDFWATWCPPCRAEVPNLVKAYDAYKDKGFEIVGISFDESREKLDDYIIENSMKWPQYFDGKGWANLVGPTYGIQSIPGMYLLDKKGKVVTTDLRDGKLEKELKKLLK